MKIDWVRKLTSRKFWLAIVGFVTPLCLAFGVSQDMTTQTAGIIMAGATMIAYIIGEGLIDSSTIETSTTTDISTENDAVTEDESLYSTTAIGFGGGEGEDYE